MGYVIYLFCLATSASLFKLSSTDKIFKHKIILIFFLWTVILKDPFRSAAQQELLIYNGIITSSVFLFPLSIMDQCITFPLSAVKQVNAPQESYSAGLVIILVRMDSH